MLKKLFLIVLVGMCAGCSARTSMPTTAPESQYLLRENVTRFRDEEAGVVCWVYKDAYKGGISCLPLYDTQLGEQEKLQ